MGSIGIFRVLVVGGGTCGLAVAQGLHKAGIEYTLFERDSANEYWNKTRDWGMMLHWGKDFLMRLLPKDLQDRFGETLVDPTLDETKNMPIPHINGRTGEVMARIGGPSMVRVSRKKLRYFMTSDRDLNIEFSKKVSSIESTGSVVTVTFTDGSFEQGNMLIGCDGSRSKVREYLVGSDAARPTDTGMTIINTSASCYTAEQALLLRQNHPIATCFYDPDVSGIFLLTVLDAAEDNRPETWTFQVHHSWWGAPQPAELKEPSARLKFLKERGAKICEPFSTAVSALPQDTVLPVDPAQQWSPVYWDNRNGTVTIAGDAAHSMLPHRGQGLNNAMQDAAEVVDAVTSAASGNSSLSIAITGYEEKLRPRGANDVLLSFETATKLLISELKESPIFKLGLQKVHEKEIVAVPTAVEISLGTG